MFSFTKEKVLSHKAAFRRHLEDRTIIILKITTKEYVKYTLLKHVHFNYKRKNCLTVKYHLQITKLQSTFKKCRVSFNLKASRHRSTKMYNNNSNWISTMLVNIQMYNHWSNLLWITMFYLRCKDIHE